MLDLISRPAGDILSRAIRFSLGGREYILPVRSIAANRTWVAAVNGQQVEMLSSFVVAGDDVSGIMSILAGQIDTLIDLLLAYDHTHVLPTKADIEAIEPDCSAEIVDAMREVWRAANPLVATGIRALMTEPQTNGSSEPTSSPPPSTAGRRARSKKN